MNTARAAVSIIFSSISSLGVRLVTLSVLARLLEPAHFGVVAMAVSIQTMISLLAQLDLRDALIQAKFVTRRHLRVAWVAVSVLALISYAAIFAASGVVENWTGIAGIGQVLRVVGLLQFFDLLLVPVEAMLIRRGLVNAVALANVSAYGLGFGVVGILAAWIAPSAMALAAAWVALGAVRLAASVWQLQRLPQSDEIYAPNSEVTSRAIFRENMRFALFGTANRFFTSSARQVDIIVVGTVLGGTQLGLYSRAYSLAEAPINTLLGMTIRSVIFPALARIQEDPSRLARAATNALAAGALLILPLVFAFSSAAPEIIRILLGPGWEDSIFPFQCLALSLGLSFIPRISVAVGRALGRQSVLFWMNLGMTLLLMGGVWAGARWKGIDGAAIAVLISSVAQATAALALMGLLVQRSPWALAATLVRAAGLALVATLVFWLALSGLRALEVPVLARLLVAGAAMGLAGLIAILCAPGLLLGPWERALLGTAARRLLPKHPLANWIVARIKGE